MCERALRHERGHLCRLPATDWPIELTLGAGAGSLGSTGANPAHRSAVQSWLGPTEKERDEEDEAAIFLRTRQILDASLPMLCGCDAACKYLRWFCKPGEQKLLCAAGGQTECQASRLVTRRTRLRRPGKTSGGDPKRRTASSLLHLCK